MKRILVLGLIIAVGVAVFLACGGGGGGSAERTGIVRVIGDTN